MGCASWPLYLGGNTVKTIFKTICAMRAISECAPLHVFGRAPAEIPEVSAAYQQMQALFKSQCVAAGVEEMSALLEYNRATKL